MGFDYFLYPDAILAHFVLTWTIFSILSPLQPNLIMGCFHIQSNFLAMFYGFFYVMALIPSHFESLSGVFEECFIFLHPNSHFVRIWVTKLYFIIKNLCDSHGIVLFTIIIVSYFCWFVKTFFLPILPGTLTSSSNGKSVLLTNLFNINNLTTLIVTSQIIFM